MVTRAVVIAGVLLTLVLPIYPQGITPPIAVFLALAGLGGMLGLMSRAARRELMVLSPWLGALLLGVLVGSLRQGESRQALEDSLPYLLFMIGLVAGRGSARPRGVLVAVLLVCFVDSLISLYRMPGFGPGMRSTYTYYKITAGLPLVGLYATALLRHTDRVGRSPSLMARPLHLVMVVVMLLGLFATVSRGMMLGFVLGALVTAYIRRPSQVLLFSLLVCVGLLAWSSVFLEVGEKYLRLRSAGTIEGRFEEIESAWQTFLRYPLFGAGLGASFVIEGFHKAFVHNMAAYHLWKFGLVGSAVLAVPLLIIARQLRSLPRVQRAIAVGGALSVIAYLVTCAAYKTYYLVWILGVVSGSSLSWLAAWQRQRTAPLPEPPEPAEPPDIPRRPRA